ncbi:hypothetical protein E2562_034532 [Oryza meyeriana var. granulata]|uniref:Serpin domain-containing protein n=1 Tax=Oryza meyeriana var. granulata TaxID=110450 RepID=A0A6G1CAJ1_9ORYZ|nr:hypothetical protein E2562_034532 [Oryza meyeriana var. granulata]
MGAKTKASKKSRHGESRFATERPPPIAGEKSRMCQTPPSCAGLTELALRLARMIPATGDEGGNLVFSPLSVYAALALVATGAGGDTLSELLGVLGVASDDELDSRVGRLAGQALADRSSTGGPRVSFVSGVWHDMSRTLTPSFQYAAVRSFMAEARAVDFRKQFHRLEGTDVDARFMQSFRRHYIACHDGFKVLRLPYEEGQPASPPSLFSMCIFLPDARDGLRDLLDEIASTPAFLQANLPTKTVQVGEFMLPKFKLTFSDDIAGVLHGLGLEVTFSNKADFSTMVEDDGSGRTLSMKNLIHRAVIEVNEEGTEAAAITGGTMCGATMSKRPPPVLVDFVADHPFAFFVIEETSGAVVFAGRVLDPSSTPGALDHDITFE